MHLKYFKINSKQKYLSQNQNKIEFQKTLITSNTSWNLVDSCFTQGLTTVNRF